MNKIKYFFILILFSASCAKNIGGGKSNIKEEKLEKYSEDLSTFLPKYETPKTVTPSKAQSQKAPTPKATVNKNVVSDTEKVDEVLTKMSYANSQISEAMGYRIQLFSGIDRSDFEAAKNYIYRNHSELGLYESYSQPTYKIRVGDFISKSMADKYYQTLKPHFGAIRIVTEKIDIKKAREIK